MPKYLFRRAHDIIIKAETPEAALELLPERVEGPEDFKLLGTADLAALDPDLVKAAENMQGFVLMSVQYRGENFACMCQVEDLNKEYVSVKPIALLLSKEQKLHLTDVMGDSPDVGLRKKLNLNKGQDDE